jgi:predicted GNAT family N-acyltransferase
VIESLSESQIRELHALFQGEWWTKGRSLDDVRDMLEHTSVVVALEDEAGRLAAFARVLTDRVYRAYLYDVIVRSDLRDTGLGARLVHAVIDHPALARVQHIELGCKPELVPFYERFGFRADLGGSLVMRRVAV